MYICTPFAVIAQLVEHQLPKLRVASSSLVYRSSVRQSTNIKQEESLPLMKCEAFYLL